MPKIVIVDSDFDSQDLEIAQMEKAGIDYEVYQSRTAKDIIANAKDADGVVTSYGNFPAEVFEALPQLKVVSRTGIGFDTIDVEAATKNGTAVCVVPGYGTEVVSDHAITLALSVLRRIPQTDADMRRGVWDYAAHKPYGQVYGRTFGVVGMGQIGRAVARKAHGLGFKVICYSRSLIPGRKTPEGYECFTYEEVLRQADVISFNCALNNDTFHLLDEAAISLLKPTAVIVNTSRGAVIDTIALAKALEEGRIWGAGLDVFEGEPLDFDSPIAKAPNTVLTPHSAYYSEESGYELKMRTITSAIDVVLGRKPVDCINPEVFD